MDYDKCLQKLENKVNTAVGRNNGTRGDGEMNSNSGPNEKMNVE